MVVVVVCWLLVVGGDVGCVCRYVVPCGSWVFPVLCFVVFCVRPVLVCLCVRCFVVFVSCFALFVFVSVLCRPCQSLSLYLSAYLPCRLCMSAFSCHAGSGTALHLYTCGCGCGGRWFGGVGVGGGLVMACGL